MNGARLATISAALLALTVSALPLARAQIPPLEELEQRIGVVNDMNEIERFHHIYGWQQDYMIYYSQADLAS
ncbi:MAG: hypothetical protein GX535_13960, partial [Xanthomonadaceae bacterium]|nr:hypothetical protein [Xanthomonadaceae bacterium]